jgi:hypothetical protein
MRRLAAVRIPPRPSAVAFRPGRQRALLLATALGLGMGVGLLGPGCLEAPRPINGLGDRGLSLRVHVFGADADQAQGMLDWLTRSNPGLRLASGNAEAAADGDVVIGLDRDEPPCAAAEGSCQYRMSLRVRDPGGRIRLGETRNVSSDGQSCSLRCKRTLQEAITQAMETSVGVLTRPVAATDPPAPKLESLEVETGQAVQPVESTTASPDSQPPALPLPTSPGNERSAAADAGTPTQITAVEITPRRPARAARPRAVAASRTTRSLTVCPKAGHGRLRADEVERRLAQLELLQKSRIITGGEYQCLRRQLLARL